MSEYNPNELLPRHTPPRSPVSKTKSVAIDSDSPRVSVERFLSVDQSPKRGGLDRRRSGSGLQDLSGYGSSDTSRPSKGKSLLNDLLNPIKTYARRRSQPSSRDCSSSELSSTSTDDEGPEGAVGGGRRVNPNLKLINDENDMNRRGSLTAFFSIMSRGNRNAKSLSTSRRNSIDSNDDFKPRKVKKDKKRSKGGKRKNSLDVAKARQTAESSRSRSESKAPVERTNSGRKDSIDLTRDRNMKATETRSANQSPVTERKDGRDRRHSEASNIRKSKGKHKLLKKKSLGETLSLKIPVSAIRRNSIDAFSLRSLFSSSRKNSEEDIKGSSKQKADKIQDNLLRVSQMNAATKRRHSHGGPDTSTESSYIYRPMARPRNRLNSLTANSRYSESPSSRSRARTPSIGMTNSSDEYSRADSRRRSSGGVSVVVSPPSSTTSGSSLEYSDAESYHSGMNIGSGSMSHSSITSLDSEESLGSAMRHRPPVRRVKPKHILQRVDRRHSSSSRASSTASDDVFDDDSDSSVESDEEPKERDPSPPRGGGFWESLQAQPPPLDITASSDEDFYNLYDDFLFDGRRNSGDLHDRSRHSSTSGSLSSVYIRGSMNPDVVAGVFRDARRLPAVDRHLVDMLGEEEESKILVKFFQLHRSYDLIPTSAKLVIFDTSLQVKKAFYALVHNGVRAAPLWDHTKQKFVGMLTITDFIRILQSFHHNHDPQMETLEDHRLHMWRTMLHDEDRPLISISPDASLFEAIKSLIHHKIHRLPVIDENTGNVLYIITHKRIIKFLYLYIRELPQPSILNKTIGELELGTYTDIETASPDTLIIEALDKFVERRISALPIVDEKGTLVDIYAKFDVLNLAAEGTYHQLNVTLSKANESRNEWFEGVLSCTREETLRTVMDRIVSAEVHRLVVVDESKKVVGVLSLSDILKELVLKPSEEKSVSELREATLQTSVDDVTATPEDNQSEQATDALEIIPTPLPPSSPSVEGDPLIPTSQSPVPTPEGKGQASSGDSEDEGRYSMDKSEESPPPSQQR